MSDSSPSSRSRAGPGARLLRAWSALSGLPGGKWLFSRAVGWVAPYSGTTGAVVRELEPGRCAVEMREKRRVRNHLDSIHAVALVNVGELATGLATLTALPPGARGIIVELDAEYRKKARGLVRAECRSGAPLERAGAEVLEESVEHRAVARIRDGDDDVVATVTALWRISPPEDA